uniref:PAM2 domain-containing protein n=1 Tax=Heterorhabditis bacteriophora TaxID=37862 RepID=A0A1I7X908_HETBA
MDVKAENAVKAEAVHFPFLQNGMQNGQLARNPFYDTNNMAQSQKQHNDVFSGMNLSMQAFNTSAAPVKDEQVT